MAYQASETIRRAVLGTSGGLEIQRLLGNGRASSPRDTGKSRRGVLGRFVNCESTELSLELCGLGNVALWFSARWVDALKGISKYRSSTSHQHRRHHFPAVKTIWSTT